MASSKSTKRKVFCLGLSRTGTTALSEKLTHYGYRTIHYSLNAYVTYHEVKQDFGELPCPKSGGYWRWVFDREIRSQSKLSFQDYLNEYDAFADLPFPFMYKELQSLYPDAYFILTTREVEKWLRSMQWLMSDGKVLWHQGLLDDSILQATYGTSDYSPELLRESYTEHNQKVRDHFAGDPRFIELTLENGDLDNTEVERFLDLAPIPNPKVNRNQQRSVSAWQRFKHRAVSHSRSLHFLSTLMQKFATTKLKRPSVSGSAGNLHH